MNACAVQSASASAWCGRLARLAEQSSSAASDSRGGAIPSRKLQEQAAEHSRCRPLRQRAPQLREQRRQERPLDAAGVKHRHPPASSSSTSSTACCSGGALARSTTRSLCISTALCFGAARCRAHQRVLLSPRIRRPSLDRHRADRDDLVLVRVKAGQLEVERAPAGLSPRRLDAGRPAVAKAAAAPRAALAVSRAAAHARKPPLDGGHGPEHVAQVVSGQRADRGRLDPVVGRGAARELLHVVADPQLQREFERLDQRLGVAAASTPSPSAARRRSGVDPSTTPAAAPAQRASSTIGITAARRMSSTSLRGAVDLEHAIGVEPGRRAVGERAARRARQHPLTHVAARRSEAARAGVPHSTRRSINTVSDSSSSPRGSRHSACVRATTAPVRPQLAQRLGDRLGHPSGWRLGADQRAARGPRPG